MGDFTVKDYNRWLDRLAMEIKAFGPRGRQLLPLYERLERELAAVQAEEDTMQRVMERIDNAKKDDVSH